MFDNNSGLQISNLNYNRNLKRLSIFMELLLWIARILTGIIWLSSEAFKNYWIIRKVLFYVILNKTEQQKDLLLYEWRRISHTPDLHIFVNGQLVRFVTISNHLNNLNMTKNDWSQQLIRIWRDIKTNMVVNALWTHVR